MLMTEEEAKTKWCPHTRLAAPVDSEAAGTSGNRYGDDALSGCRCIGSQCMAWRCGKPAIERQGSLGDGANPHAFRPNGDGWEFIKRAWQRTVPRGYCGLAGRVEP